MITEGDAQRRLEQAAKFASRSEEYGQFEMEHFNNQKVPGAASPLLLGAFSASPSSGVLRRDSSSAPAG